MFTVGIFSTHLPYLAFVFFYAWFILFGIQEVSNGERETIEKSCFSKSYFVTQTNNPINIQNFDYADNFSALNFRYSRNFRINNEIKGSSYMLTKTSYSCFSFSLFNRPPPIKKINYSPVIS